VTFEKEGNTRLALKSPIKWRNYFDKADPVGFRLDGAAEFLRQRDCNAFEFEPHHDMGYSRSLLPGAAHVDYWNDGDVFKHFIDDVVFDTKKAVVPQTRLGAAVASLAIPYLMVVAVIAAAVFVLYKAIAFAEGDMGFRDTAQALAVLTICLTLVTVAARIPRLVKPDGYRWHTLAATAYLTSALLLWFALPDFVLLYFSGASSTVPVENGAVDFRLLGGRGVLLVFGLAVVLASWTPLPSPRLGRRLLIGLAALVLAVVIGVRLYHGGKEDVVWPIVLAGAVFLYLWWLSILLFDLSFVWHRYIRQSVACANLRSWQDGKDAKADPYWGLPITPAAGPAP
jgi:hypothetical protein